MSRPRSITEFFGRPRFPAANSGSSHQESGNDGDAPVVPSQSTPQTELSPPLAENTSSKHSDASSASPGLQQKVSPLDVAKYQPEETPPSQSFQSARTTGDSSVGASFTSSQRLVKDGKELVTGTDGEETDSVASLEDPDELLKRFTCAKDDTPDEPSKDPSTGRRMSLRSRNEFTLPAATQPDYKNTLDMLVTEAVDDNETEAGVAKLKEAFELEAARNHVQTKPDAREGGGLREDMLTSALGDKDDELGLQRLLEAVRRTEAFEQEKSWLFFDCKAEIQPVLDFPREAIAPGTHLAGLRDPDSRERMFHSGIIDFALSNGFLPDELVTWIFRSVPSEHRDEMRKAYCRAFKHVTAERVRSLIHPENVNDLFRRMGAGPKALTISEPVVPDPSAKYTFSEKRHVDRGALVSIFELLRDGAELFSDDTRIHVLNILFRLTIDRSLTADAVISSELERTIAATLESGLKENVENMMHNVSKCLYDTIKDASFQSRILTHLLPTSDWIALLRCRLAVAFLTQTPDPLTEPPDVVLNLRRITELLQDRRFDTKRNKHKSQEGYDYGELSALTTLLDVAIEPRVPRNGFPSQAAEREYNTEVDSLAERIKVIYTSIQGLGASHLKRMLAKSSLETLHYRILYSVRSRPPPKVSMFGDISAANIKQYYPRKSEERSSKQQ